MIPFVQAFGQWFDGHPNGRKILPVSDRRISVLEADLQKAKGEQEKAVSEERLKAGIVG